MRWCEVFVAGSVAFMGSTLVKEAVIPQLRAPTSLAAPGFDCTGLLSPGVDFLPYTLSAPHPSLPVTMIADIVERPSSLTTCASYEPIGPARVVGDVAFGSSVGSEVSRSAPVVYPEGPAKPFRPGERVDGPVFVGGLLGHDF